MEYGQLVRKIRLDKGFSQKEIYSGIVTKSYCIEFEKGNHDLSFRLLAQVLERLLVDVENLSFYMTIITLLHKIYGNNMNWLLIQRT